VTPRPTDVPVDLGREEARRLAESELSDPAYRAAEPGLVEQAVRRVLEWVADIAGRAAEAAPGGWLGILGLVLLLVVAALLVRWRLGPVARSGRIPIDVDPGMSSAQYRARADALAAEGRWEPAMTQRMRALARAGQELGLVDAQPGRTADEIAGELGRRLPDADGALQQAARAFDDVRYGGRPGTEAAYDLVAVADSAVAATRGVRP
jgi:hypothetical protein